MFVGVAFCLLELLTTTVVSSSDLIQFLEAQFTPFLGSTVPSFLLAQFPFLQMLQPSAPHLFAAHLRKKQSAVTETFAISFSIAPTFCTIGHRGTEG